MEKDLQEKIMATINIIHEYEVISSEDLRILLEKEGINNTDAIDISIFLPISFCKKMLPKINFPKTYIEINKSNERTKCKFSDNTLYNIVDSQTQLYFNNNPDSEVILKVSSLSAEFQAINKILLQGGSLNDIRLTETVFVK